MAGQRPPKKVTRSGTVWTEADYRAKGYGTVKLRLPLDTLERITSVAETNGISRAEVVDAAIQRPESGTRRAGAPARRLSAPQEAWDLWERAREHALDDSWAEWARNVLTIAAADELGIDPQEALAEVGL